MSGRSIKAFLDANTIISGLLFKGNEATLLELGRVKAIELVTNYYVMEEVSNVLKRGEFRLDVGEINGLVKYLNTCLTVIENPSKEAVQGNINLLDDKKDIPVAIGTAYSDADILVTGDREILEKITSACTTKKLLEKILPKNK
jgi:putative PIN family toxin of toxin-antitoxin system